MYVFHAWCFTVLVSEEDLISKLYDVNLDNDYSIYNMNLSSRSNSAYGFPLLYFDCRRSMFCVFAYTFLTVHFCIVKFAYAITHPCMRDILFGDVKSLNDRFMNCSYYSVNFFAFIQKLPICFFCILRMYFCGFTYAFLTVHLCIVKFAFAITHPCIRDVLFGDVKSLNDRFMNCSYYTVSFFAFIQKLLICFFCVLRMYECGFAYAFLTVNLCIVQFAYAIAHPCICNILIWRLNFLSGYNSDGVQLYKCIFIFYFNHILLT